MKIEVFKHPGGNFVAANEHELEKCSKFKTGELYTVEIKLTRNPKFHRKVFAFFNFCFEYWRSDKVFAHETEQRNAFRNQLTILAGFYREYYTITGKVTVYAESLAYANMSQERFEQVYSALINAALEHIFFDLDDPMIESKLMGFFS